MHLYTAHIAWERGDQAFVDNRYSRAHRWRFDGGAQVPGSSSPLSVPVPLSDPAAVDPEEAFVASLSSCHMLWFLSLAAKGGYRIDRYSDRAEGVMEKDDGGELAITRVTLRPEIYFSGEKIPSREEIAQLHHAAHSKCFIARSVKSEVRCEPIYR
ncbi:MAG TPA: OsmC family protein [Usitatibacter sp.]|nr:OsmC family protein [Usitatibacter sp.]